MGIQYIGIIWGSDSLIPQLDMKSFDGFDPLIRSPDDVLYPMIRSVAVG